MLEVQKYLRDHGATAIQDLFSEFAIKAKRHTKYPHIV